LLNGKLSSPGLSLEKKKPKRGDFRGKFMKTSPTGEEKEGVKIKTYYKRSPLIGSFRLGR